MAATKPYQKKTQTRGHLSLESLEERAMMTTAVHSLASDFGKIESPPRNAWSVNAGLQSLTKQANLDGNDMSAWTVGLKDADVRQFHSAADLDFTGDFVYAVNAGGTAVTIGDAQFADGAHANDGTINAERQIVEWYPDADYGNSNDDNTLEKIMESIRWDRSPSFSIELDVEPGQTYKLQLLFAELWAQRGLDIYIEGESVVTDLAI